MSKTAYVLSKRIARGGMAEIYLGKAVGENAFQRICAIKRILPHYAQDKEFIEMFRDEAHICKRLQQANIVQVFDFTEVEGSYALIMEHVDGADLRTLLSACEGARVRMSVPMTLYMAACCLRGLHYAHTKVDEITNLPLGIVHRDVSPQNILISYEGEVKITDFGIAAAEDKITETRPGVVKGKYSYMSPEQVSAKVLDGRSDVFAMAIVIWECLAMKRLFAGQTEVDTIRKVQNCEIPHQLHDLNTEVDEPLTKIIEKGLAKDRKRRYQTAASFEKAMLKYLNSKYPDFTPTELGNFLKQILAKKRGETQDDIKQVLTSTDLKKPTSLMGEGQGDGLQSEGAGARSAAEGGRQDDARGFAGPPLSLELDSRSATPIGLNHGERSSLNRRSTNSIRQLPTPARSQIPRYDSTAKGSSWGKRILIFLALGIVAGLYFWRGTLPIVEDKIQFELRSVPDVVSLSVNGKVLNKGGFTKTPVKLFLKSGHYQLAVSRPGFQSKLIDFQGEPGDAIQPPAVVLEKKPSAELIILRIIAKERRLNVNLDNGLGKGPTPLVVPNVLAGITHSITFKLGDGGNERPLRCTFKPIATGQTGTYVITLDPDAPRGESCSGRPY